MSIDPTNNFIRLLDHRSLIQPYRHDRCLERGDVCGLGHRIAKEARWNVAFIAPQLNFILDSRIALQSRNGNKIEIELCKFGKRGQCGLDANCRFPWIDADGKVIKRHFDHVAAHLFGIVNIVSQSLCIGQQNELLMRVLKGNPVSQGARIVAKVKRTRGAITRENDWSCSLNKHTASPGWSRRDWRLAGRRPWLTRSRRRRSLK